MKLNKTQKEHIRIEKKIDFWYKKQKQLEAKCKHKNATKTNEGSDGNIMVGRDPSYWRNCNCPDCGKHWTEDQ